MKTKAPRNCIIGIVAAKRTVCLFHVNECGDIACAINRDLKGNLISMGVDYGATMFADHDHNHWRDEVDDRSRSVIVDSHCVDPRSLNSGDLRRLAKKTVKILRSKK